MLSHASKFEPKFATPSLTDFFARLLSEWQFHALEAVTGTGPVRYGQLPQLTGP